MCLLSDHECMKNMTLLWTFTRDHCRVYMYYQHRYYYNLIRKLVNLVRQLNISTKVIYILLIGELIWFLYWRECQYLICNKWCCTLYLWYEKLSSVHFILIFNHCFYIHVSCILYIITYVYIYICRNHFDYVWINKIMYE